MVRKWIMVLKGRVLGLLAAIGSKEFNPKNGSVTPWKGFVRHRISPIGESLVFIIRFCTLLTDKNNSKFEYKSTQISYILYIYNLEILSLEKISPAWFDRYYRDSSITIIN